MSKKNIIIVTVIVLTGLGIGFLALKGDAEKPGYQSASTDATTTPSQTTPANNTTKKVASKAEAQQSTGQYIDYTSDVIAKTKGTKILFFHAPWCSQCLSLEASIEEGPIPDEVSIIKVDYDSNQKLRQQYGVTIQTSLVKVDDSGALVKKVVAYDDPSLGFLKTNLL